MKRKLTAILAFIVIFTMCAGMFTGCANQQEPASEETAPELQIPRVKYLTNPLTGLIGFDSSAKNRRIVAFVVENHPDARPQWGMDDKKYSPDIILQGEVEGGLTRTLWFYADYKSLPKQIGPMRSARPPFIRFSKLFDSIFIHWGQSASGGAYVGAKATFKKTKTPHINEMSFADKAGMYDRDWSRGTDQEHTGIVYGSKVAAAIKEKKFRNTIKKKYFTNLPFNNVVQPLGTTTCKKLTAHYSDREYESSTWYYDKKDKMYHTDEFKNNVKRTNLLVLFDKTEYITKENYHNTGQGVTYCDYKLAGGKGKLASLGTVVDIQWKVQDGKLVITDKDGNFVGLNPGKTWIGWISKNHGGSIDIKEYKD